MSFSLADAPNNASDIATAGAAMWGSAANAIGDNDAQQDINIQFLYGAIAAAGLGLFGEDGAVLPNSPSPFLTGEGTTTWTLLVGTRLAIPQGAVGSRTGVIPWTLQSSITQGKTADAVNYVWARLTGEAGTPDLVVNGGTAPADAVFVGKAQASGVIKTIEPADVDYYAGSDGVRRSTGKFLLGFSLLGSSAYLSA